MVTQTCERAAYVPKMGNRTEGSAMGTRRKKETKARKGRPQIESYRESQNKTLVYRFLISGVDNSHTGLHFKS